MLCGICGSGLLFYGAIKTERVNQETKVVWRVGLCEKCTVRVAGKRVAAQNERDRVFSLI